jgi:arabinofuranosyltransferase
MEVPLFTFLILLTLIDYLGMRAADLRRLQSLRLALLLFLTSLTRPEGIVLSGVILLDRLVRYRSTGNRRSLIAFLLFGLLPFALFYLTYIFWRYTYYGFFLPNTFYVKVGWSMMQFRRGLRYAGEFLFPAFGILLPALAALWLRRWRILAEGFYLLPLLAGIFILYVIFVGGDSMPAFRFLTPILPLLCLISALGLIQLIRVRDLLLLTCAAVISYNVILTYRDWDIYPHILSDRVAYYGQDAGIWLASHTVPDAVIATNTAGSIPYYSRRRVIDMLGLNDRHIAHREIATMGQGSPGHEKGDGQYILARRPDIIQFGSSLGSAEPFLLSDREIYAAPEFHRLYERRDFSLPCGKDLTLFVLRGKDVIRGVREPRG